MEELKIVYLPIDKLKPYKKNARKHGKDDIAAVRASIRELGFNDPIGIWSDENIIVEGHGRLLAAKAEGITEVPCIRLDHLTDEQRRAYALAHNRTAELSVWDELIKEEELREIHAVDMSALGFDLPEKETKPEPDEALEEIPEQAPPRVQRGQIWKLGKHRLMCGDSTSADDVQRLMGGLQADLLLTDPPYGIKVVRKENRGSAQAENGGGALHFGKNGGGGWYDSKTYPEIIGDDSTETAKKNYAVAFPVSENQIIFGGNHFTDFLPASRCWLVWDKQTTGNFADAELAYTSFDKPVKLYRFTWNGLCRQGNREVEGITRVHPTQKPVGLFEEILKDFSKENDLILDTFGGSGTTLIAAERLNRKCFMMELNEHYCDVIIERWEKLTGKTAELISA